MSARPYTTLFLLVSADGKISTGDTDERDVDTDYPNIKGVNEGLSQYYDLEQQTDLFSLNTGRVFAKVGINEKTDEPTKTPVSYVVVDNRPHLTANGVAYLAKKSKHLIIVTTSDKHPATTLTHSFKNIHILKYRDEIVFEAFFTTLKSDFGAERVTVQSGGTLNTKLVRDGLIDRVLLVVAPALIGGKNTSTLMDGDSSRTPDDLSAIKSLELVQAKPLDSSFLLLEYLVKN